MKDDNTSASASYASSDENGASNEALADRKRSDIWYSDGSLILFAEDTEFKIHRTLLCQHSEVFRDMLVVSDNTGGDTQDGCPVVELQDSAQDVYHALSALYDLSYLDHRKKHPISKLAGALRISTKYAISNVRNELVARLTVDCPTTLKEYRMNTVNSDSNTFAEDIHNQWAPMFDIVDLVRHAEVPKLLPAALVKCFGCPPWFLFEGIARQDGSMARLSPRDAQLILVAQTSMKRRFITDFPFSWLDAKQCPCPDCPTIGPCTAWRKRIAADLWTSDLEDKSLQELFRPWRAGWGAGLCAKCKAFCHDSYEQGCSALWQKLPEHLGFGTWQELTRGDDGDGMDAD